MPLERGAVYRVLVPVTLPDGGEGIRLKFVVVLQDASIMDQNATYVACLMCSTDNTGPDGPRYHEVQLDERDGFEHSTIADGRWVFSFRRTLFEDSRYAGFTLTEERMSRISRAIFDGLQLDL